LLCGARGGDERPETNQKDLGGKRIINSLLFSMSASYMGNVQVCMLVLNFINYIWNIIGQRDTKIMQKKLVHRSFLSIDFTPPSSTIQPLIRKL
jgi:hypothetical protein